MPDLPNFTLPGRKALVTGASRGLGRAIALALADAGADIAVGLRDVEQDEGVCAEIRAMGRRAIPLQMDVMDLPQSYAAIDRAIADPRSLGTLRALPSPEGVRLYGIRRDHPAAALGARNGDLLRSLDGIALGSPDAFLDAYARLRTPGEHALVVERRGRVETITVTIADR